MNLATPPDYRLGPGDEVIIDIWGASQNTIRETISPDGYINIPDLGLVLLNGMSVSEAKTVLKQELSKIYADSGNNIQVSLGNVRTIQINVMGEVLRPGTYTLSSFATVFHALYSAGGVSDIGSLRNIHVARNGKNVVRSMSTNSSCKERSRTTSVCRKEMSSSFPRMKPSSRSPAR